MKKILIVDMDGTVANLQHRLHLKKARRDYAEFFALCYLDKPITEVILLVEMLSQTYEIVFLTGRDESIRELTKRWIKENIKIDNFRLLMKAIGDHRCDTIYKPAILSNAGIKVEDVALALDDRNKVVKQWRKMGIPCIQVLEGEINPKRGDF